MKNITKLSLAMLGLLTTPLLFAAPVAKQNSPWRAEKNESSSQHFSSMGANYAYIGAGADIVSAGGDNETGVDAMFGLNYNLYKSESRRNVWGVDVIVPLEYTYIDMDGGGASASMHAFTFPAYVRPYYRIYNTEDLSITPFVQAGIGGRYTYMEASALGTSGWASEVSFVWAVGAGVEISFLKDFYVSGKYLYSGAETSSELSMDYWASPEHELGLEFGWRMTDKLSLLVQYKHVFWKAKHGFANSIDQDKIGACIRFDF